MSILHLSHSTSGGGAANAAVLLYQQLNSAGVESYFRYLGGYIEPSGVGTTGIARRYANRYMNYPKHYASRALLKLQRDSNFHWHSLSCFPSWFDVELNRSPHKILHLHWVQAEFISIEAIGRLKKKIVWTLHDSWSYCGAEHHVNGAEDHRFRDGYSRWNRNEGANGLDLDRWCWQRKMACWDVSRFTFIAPSSWSLNQARASRLLKEADIRLIPNIVGDTFFEISRSRKGWRKRLGISEDTSVITIGSAYAASDKNKGLDLAEKVLHECISNQRNSLLIIFGVEERLVRGLQNKYRAADRVIVLPYLEKQDLAEVFAISDLVVVPSRLESFGLVAAEAQACGTPVVAYRTSGLIDVVEDGVTGILVEAFKETEFIRTIRYLSLKPEVVKQMGRRARKRAYRLFSSEIVVSQHKKVYSDVI
jgi:glycosyltransferase involved in cell wall biosynthesis